MPNPIMHIIGAKIEILKSNHAHNRKMTKREINPVSLENLKLGAAARNKGKIRVTLTLLPETKAWLEASGNMSERVDELVRRIRVGELVKKVD